MERLTTVIKTVDGKEVVYYAKGLYPPTTIVGEMTHDEIRECMRKLADYENAEEQGLLIKLPCKVGDVVYEVQELRKRIQPMEITGVKINRLGGIYFEWELYLGIGVYHSMNGMKIDDIGKRVFLTREEAEAKLAEMRGE